MRENKNLTILLKYFYTALSTETVFTWGLLTFLNVSTLQIIIVCVCVSEIEWHVHMTYECVHRDMWVACVYDVWICAHGHVGIHVCMMYVCVHMDIWACIVYDKCMCAHGQTGRSVLCCSAGLELPGIWVSTSYLTLAALWLYMFYNVSFCMGSWDLNSGPQASTGSICLLRHHPIPLD